MSTDTPEGDRIAKMLSRAGVASRRDAERMILDGRVKVNGKVVTSPALNVTASDRLMVDDQPVARPEPTRIWVYHKPPGVVTTTVDEQGRETVFEGLPEDMPRVMSVGRLDLTSEGLLLLTNDGEAKRKLELPSTGWLRRYRVRINGTVSEAQLDKLRAGVTVDDVDYAPMEVQFDRQQGANAWLTVGLREGKNREIRRVMEYLGVTVNRLIRVSYGPFQLGELPSGAVKEVPRKVVREQLGFGGEPEEQVLTRRPRGAKPVKVRPIKTGPVMRTTKGGPRPGEGGGKPRPVAPEAGEGKPAWTKPARTGHTADRPGRSPEKADTIAAARDTAPDKSVARKPRSAGFKSHRPEAEGDAPRGKPAGMGRSSGYKSHRATDGERGPRKAPYKPKGPVAASGRDGGDTPRSRGPSAGGEEWQAKGRGFAPRAAGAEGEGYRSRGPKPKGEGFASRGPKADVYKPRAPKGEGYAPRGPKAEGYKSRGPKSDSVMPREGRGDGPAPRGPMGEGFKSRGPKDAYRGPRVADTAGSAVSSRPPEDGAPTPRKPRHKSRVEGFKSHDGGDGPKGGPAGGKKRPS